MTPIVVFLVHLAYATHCHLPAASCPNVPSASVDAVCRAAVGEEFMYELCLNAMRDVSEPKNEVSLYALVAAKHAQASYDNTEQALGGLLGSVSPCAEKYQEAGGTMGAVADALLGCRFAGLGQRYRDGVAQLESCRDRLLKAISSPLYAMNLLDRNKAILAYIVGGLLAGVDP